VGKLEKLAAYEREYGALLRDLDEIRGQKTLFGEE